MRCVSLTLETKLYTSVSSDSYRCYSLIVQHQIIQSNLKLHDFWLDCAKYLDIRQGRYKSLSNVLLLELSSSITRLGYQLVTLSESV